MANVESTTRYCLPKIGRIRLGNFDLYNEQPNIDVGLKKNVFCLIGANGLGKTTFLNTVVYGLTGAVPDPTRKFLSAQKYAKDAARSDRTADYFEGRISESNRSSAGVTLDLIWPENQVSVRRSFFDSTNISEVIVTDRDGQVLKHLSADTASDAELQRAYKSAILEMTGILEYAQFIFLVHFILTFDESRHLLMWDDTALTNALYLAFGSDPNDAVKADKLRAEVERMASKGRNAKYAARQIADRMKSIAEVAELDTEDEVDTSEDADGLLQMHTELIEQLAEKEKRRDEKKVSLQDTELKWTEASSKLTEVQLEHQKKFSVFFQGSSAAHHHPIVKATISENRCAVCATEGVSQTVSELLDADTCPLCKNSLDHSSTSERDAVELKQLDEQISKSRDEISLLLNKRDRLDAEYKASIAAANAASELLAEFEDASGDLLSKNDVVAEGASVQYVLKQMELQHNQITEESKKFYLKRDELRRELKPLEVKLRREYDEAATIFVPRFRELAESFIGKDIDIGLKHYSQSKTKTGFGLTLSMGGEPRQQSTTVSESQGFFIDIALRMALAEYISNGAATLFIDTPEGSLDIAYEAKAGAMFANFANTNNCILMTANLRSSELVQRLAERQGHSGMQIEKMTEWTELSEVQKEEERLFESAYEEISSALGGS